MSKSILLLLIFLLIPMFHAFAEEIYIFTHSQVFPYTVTAEIYYMDLDKGKKITLKHDKWIVETFVDTKTYDVPKNKTISIDAQLTEESVVGEEYDKAWINVSIKTRTHEFNAEGFLRVILEAEAYYK